MVRTAIKHPMPDLVKPSFKNYKWRLNLVWHRMLRTTWQQWASKG